jgi:hypothetical protein
MATMGPLAVASYKRSGAYLIGTGARIDLYHANGYYNAFNESSDSWSIGLVYVYRAISFSQCSQVSSIDF